MSVPFNPLQLQTYDITKSDQAKMFVLQLANMLNQAFTPNGISAILDSSGSALPGSMSSAANTIIGNNTGGSAPDTGLTVAQVGAMFSGSAAIPLTGLKQVVSINSPQTGSVSVACDNAASVFIYVRWTAATSTNVNLAHLGFGVPVTIFFTNGSGAGNAYSVTATDPGGTAYTQIGATFASAATGTGFTDLTTGATVLSSGLSVTYSGMSGGTTGAGRMYFAP